MKLQDANLVNFAVTENTSKNGVYGELNNMNE